MSTGGSASGGSASKRGLHPGGPASRGSLHPGESVSKGGPHPGGGHLHPGGLHLGASASRGIWADYAPQIGYNRIGSMSGQYASYWNAFLSYL